MSLFALLKVRSPQKPLGYARNSKISDVSSYYETVTDDDDKTGMSEDARLAQKLQQQEIAKTQQRILKNYPKWDWIPSKIVSGKDDINSDIEKNNQTKVDYKYSQSIDEDGDIAVSGGHSYALGINKDGHGQIDFFNKPEKFDEMPVSNGLHTTENDAQKKAIEQSEISNNTPESQKLQNVHGMIYKANIVGSDTAGDKNKTNDGCDSFLNRQGDCTDARNVKVQGQNKGSSDRLDYIQGKETSTSTTDLQYSTPSKGHKMFMVQNIGDGSPCPMVDESDKKLVTGGVYRANTGPERLNMKGKTSEMNPPVSVGNSVYNKVLLQSRQQSDPPASFHPQLSSLKNSNDQVELRSDISSYSSAYLPAVQSEVHGNVTSSHDTHITSIVDTSILPNEHGHPSHSNHTKSVTTQLQGDNAQFKHENSSVHLALPVPLTDHGRQDRLSRQEANRHTVLEPDTVQNQSSYKLPTDDKGAYNHPTDKGAYKHPTDNRGAYKNAEFSNPEYKRQLLNNSEMNTDLQKPVMNEVYHSVGEEDCSLVLDKEETDVEKDDLQFALRLQEEEDAQYAQRLQSHNHSPSSKYKEQQNTYANMQETSQSVKPLTVSIYTTDKFLDGVFHHPWPSTLERPVPRQVANQHYNKLLEKQYKVLVGKTGISSDKVNFSENVSKSPEYDRHHKQHYIGSDSEKYWGNWTAAGKESSTEIPPLGYTSPKETCENNIKNVSHKFSGETEYLGHSNESLLTDQLSSVKTAGNGEELTIRDNYRDEVKYKHLQTVDYLKNEKNYDSDRSNKQVDREYSQISGFTSDWLEKQHPVGRKTDKKFESHAQTTSDKLSEKYSVESAGSDTRYCSMPVMNTEAHSYNYPSLQHDIHSLVDKNMEISNGQMTLKQRGEDSKVSQNSLFQQNHRSGDCDGKKDVTYSRNEPFQDAGMAGKKSAVSGKDFPMKSPDPSKSDMAGEMKGGPSKPTRKPKPGEIVAMKHFASGFMHPFEQLSRKKMFPQGGSAHGELSKIKTKRNREQRQQEIFGDELNLDDYETCWEVAEMLGDVKTLGLNTEEISNFPSHDYQEGDDNVVETECRICLTSFQKGDKIRTLPCLHLFHYGCINEWLTRNAICPVCRTTTKGF